jgi:hypothetical protein
MGTWNDGTAKKVELYRFHPQTLKAPPMAQHLPPIPPANRRSKEPTDEAAPDQNDHRHWFVVGFGWYGQCGENSKDRATRRLPTFRRAGVSGRWHVPRRSGQRNHWRQQSGVSDFYSAAGDTALDQVHSTMTGPPWPNYNARQDSCSLPQKSLRAFGTSESILSGGDASGPDRRGGVSGDTGRRSRPHLSWGKAGRQ